jgi:hypothetical protein
VCVHAREDTLFSLKCSSKVFAKDFAKLDQSVANNAKDHVVPLVINSKKSEKEIEIGKYVIGLHIFKQ